MQGSVNKSVPVVVFSMCGEEEEEEQEICGMDM